MTDELLNALATPDPDRIATQRDFGRELTLARKQAGLTVRQVARAAKLPASTVGDYFAGRHLPPLSQPLLLARILGACTQTDPDVVGRWTTALGRARRAPGPRPAATAAPYRGLASFQPGDAAWFFGREELARLLVSRLDDGSSAGIPLMVVGPSGSGKSSLLRAGLIPALSQAPAAGSGGLPGSLALLTPGACPVESLARELLAAQPPAASQAEPGDLAAALRSGGHCGAAAAMSGLAMPVAIIVDQFEEIFTACPDEEERQAFIGVLCALSGPAAVVLGMRADFYGHALRHPELAAALQSRQVVVGPMSQAQLRRTIVEPARRAKLDVGEGLVELLLADLAPSADARGGPQAGHEQGALPLLSHALLSTWERSRGGRLTVADYQSSGGIRDAIARTAELVYESLPAQEKHRARRLFLALVRVSDDAIETRRRVGISELASACGDGPSASQVLKRFVDGRLITVGDDTAEITHEALLAAWPRLREWIDADREGLGIRRRIGEGARAWQEAGRDVAGLPRGGQLAIARDWAADPVNRGSLSPAEREFVGAGIAHEQQEISAERHRARRLRQLVASLTVLVLATAGLTGYAFAQRRAADAARDNADSRELAVEASQLRGQDVSLAAQLSLAAYQTARTPEALASLLESSGTPAAARFLDSAGVVEAVALSRDRRTLAVAGADGTLRLWDTARPSQPVALGPALAGPSDSPLYTAAFSPDGKVLAAAGAGATIRLWDVSDPRRPVLAGRPLTGPANTVYSVAFSPDGATLAAGSADRTVRLWNVASLRQPVALATLTGPTNYVQAVAFSPDGTTLAAGSADATVRLWKVADPGRPTALGGALTGPADVVTSVTFSPDGQTVAAGGRDNRVWLWHLAGGRPTRLTPLTGATDWVNVVAFSPDGTMLAAGASDGSVRLWNLATGRLLATLPHPGVVTALAWSGTRMLISGGADGAVRMWTLPSPVLATDGPVNSVGYSPGGGRLAVGSQDLEVWNPADRTEIAAVSVPGTFVNALAYSPDGTMLATGYGDGSIQLWATGHGRPAPLSAPLSATTTGQAEFVAFSPDRQILASAGDDGSVRLWNISDPAHPGLLAKVHDSGATAFSVAFSPNGRLLAVASGDNLTRLWNIASPARPVLLGRPLAGLASYAISVAFRPDGRVLAIGSADKTVRLWDVTDPGRPAVLGLPLTGPEGYVYSVAFSRSGATLAAGVTDDSTWLWDVSDPAAPALVAELTGPTGHVYTVAFSPGGQTLAAGSADGTVRLWDVQVRAAASAVCGTAGQAMTRSEWSRFVPGRGYAPPCA